MKETAAILNKDNRWEDIRPAPLPPKPKNVEKAQFN